MSRETFHPKYIKEHRELRWLHAVVVLGFAFIGTSLVFLLPPTESKLKMIVIILAVSVFIETVAEHIVLIDRQDERLKFQAWRRKIRKRGTKRCCAAYVIKDGKNKGYLVGSVRTKGAKTLYFSSEPFKWKGEGHKEVAAEIYFFENDKNVFCKRFSYAKNNAKEKENS